MLPIVEQIKFVSDHPNELVVFCVAGKDFGMLRYIGDGTPCPEEQLFRLSITKSFLTDDLKQQHLASFEKRWTAFLTQKWE